MKQAEVLKLAFVAALVVLVAAPVVAAPAVGGVADVAMGVTQVEWVPTQEYAGLTLTVSGPEGVSERTFAAGENPIFDLASVSGRDRRPLQLGADRQPGGRIVVHRGVAGRHRHRGRQALAPEVAAAA